jgi:hypothetical protein
MATNRKAPPLKPTQAPFAQEDLPGDALQTALQTILAQQATVAQAFKAADDATSELAGYDAVLAASKAAGLTWDALHLWVPEDLKPGELPGTGEQLIREIHAAADPASAERVVTSCRDALQLVSNASDEQAVLDTRRLGNNRVFPLHSKDRDASKAQAGLQENYNAAVRAKDHAGAAEWKEYLDAVDKVPEMIALSRKLGSVRTAYSRFRSRLFLHLVDATFRQNCPASELGANYRQATSLAKKEHHAYMRQDGQHRSVAGLEAHVLGKLAQDLQKKFDVEQMKSAPTAAEKKLEVLHNIVRWVRKAVSRKLLTQEGADSMLAWITVPDEANYQNSVGFTPAPVVAKDGTPKKPKADKPPVAAKSASAKKKAATPAPTPKPKTPVAPIVTRRQVAATPAAAPKAKAPVSRSVGNVADVVANLKG